MPLSENLAPSSLRARDANEVLYPFLKVPHCYFLERSQLLQHPLPLTLLHHYSQLAQQHCLLPQGYSLL